MVRKVYLADGTINSGQVLISSIGNEPDGRRYVLLDWSPFHPRGGGQPEDKGTLGAIKVVDVRMADDGEIRHFVECLPLQWKIADSLEAVIDPLWRRLVSRWHTAGHLLAACIEASGPSLKAVQGHHWPNEGRVEFEGGPLNEPDSVRLLAQEKIDEAITADLAVTVIAPHSNRQVRIGNFKPIACGGTHVSSLAVLGRVAITGMKSRKGKIRASYAVDD